MEEVDLELRLSTLKPLQAGWLVDFYNHIKSADGKDIISSGWKASYQE